MNIKNEVLGRMYIVLIVFVLAAIFIFSKVLGIVVVDGDRWRKLGKSSYVSHKDVAAERGNVYAEDRSLLATSLPFFEIRFDTKADGLTDELFNENVDSLSYCLSTFVNTDYTVGGMKQYLEESRAAGKRYLLISKRATYGEMVKMSNFPLFRRGKYGGGFIALKTPKRERPFGMLAYRTIGYVNDRTKLGLEGKYDKVLHGKTGKRLMQKINGGIWIPVNDLTEVEPISGNDIITTIDVDIQDITQKALIRALEHHNAKKGVAIVMDVKTGAIRSMSNISKTDKGWWEMYNDAIGTAIEPGSTFKLATVMALLEDGYVDLQDTVSVEHGRTKFYDKVMVDATSKTSKLDSITLRRAFEVSSNVGIAKLAYDHYHGQDRKGRIKVKRFLKRLKQFNLHLPTGIDLDGEPHPYIKDPNDASDNWSGTTLPWMATGYELLQTPLQSLAFYNAVANDGRMMKPYLVSEIDMIEGEKKLIKPTVVRKHIASKATVRKAKLLLEGVVKNGTARDLYTKKYDFAGKTGTTQINYKKKNKRTEYRASFVGYFPAEKPKYSCIIVITDPKRNGFYGGTVAGPVFREIADKVHSLKLDLQVAINEKSKPRLKSYYLPNQSVGKTEDIKKILTYLELPVKQKSFGKMTVIRPKADTVWMLRRKIKKNIIPSLKGMGLRDALDVLENIGLTVEHKGLGKVVAQSIKVGTKAKGQTIKIVLK